MQAQLFAGFLYYGRIRFYRGFAEVAQNHFAVAGGDFLPGAEHYIAVRLLEVELGNGGNGRAETAQFYTFAHCFDYFGEFIKGAVVAHHLGIGRQRAAGQGRERNNRVDLCGFGRQEVFAHAILEHIFGFADFLRVNVQGVIRAAQSVPHS